MVYTVRTCSYAWGPILLLNPHLIKNKTEAQCTSVSFV